MEVNGVAVMRRRNDSWLNATQILKVAGIDKGKRTKVLEKEILAGEHEKVQGGYGKYQGTWINYRRGVDFCRGYGVEELLRPLLEYDMGQDGMTAAGQGNVDTPTKEQAMAAQRKRNLLNGGIDNRPTASSPNGTFFKNISKTAANAVNAISKARFDSPGPRPGSGNKRPAPVRKPSQQMMGSQESLYVGSSQQSMQSLHSENSFGANSHLDPALRAHSGPYFTNTQENHNGDFHEPPRKRVRPSSSQDPFSYDMNYDTSMREVSPTEPNESFVYQPQPNMDITTTGLAPLPQPTSDAMLQKQQLLMNLFLDPSQTDFSKHPALLRLSAEDLDIPIDKTAHTALHWAATLARTSLLRALISKGASIFRLNGGGETALIRAALTTNNLDQNSFSELLELLGPTIEIRDGRGRTVLHHLAVSAAVKGRSEASRYYLESLLEFVVRQGSAQNSQQTSFNGPEAVLVSAMKPIGLARFMAEIVNAQDISGDTALALAARIGNMSITQQLLEIGANPTIPNRGGLKPIDFGVGGEPEPTDVEPSSQIAKLETNPVNKVMETSQELINGKPSQKPFTTMTHLIAFIAISTLLSDTSSSFKSELQTKQSLIDQTHATLRETTALLTAERRRLEDLQRKSSEHKDLRLKIENLRRANNEQRTVLSRSGNAPQEARADVKIGEADAGLEIDPSLTNIELLNSGELTPQQFASISPLPPSKVLQARVLAYRRNNVRLQTQAKDLSSRSLELEGQLRKLVALCTGVEESRVDEMLAGLVAAVESERGEDVEVGRVREFLRRVEGVEGE